jgi:hypothetical protein
MCPNSQPNQLPEAGVLTIKSKGLMLEKQKQQNIWQGQVKDQERILQQGEMVGHKKYQTPKVQL